MARTPSSTRGSNPEAPALPEGTRVAAVVSTFHADLTRAMAESARSTLLTS